MSSTCSALPSAGETIERTAGILNITTERLINNSTASFPLQVTENLTQNGSNKYRSLQSCVPHNVPRSILCNTLGLILLYYILASSQSRGKLAAAVPAITADITTSKERRRAISVFLRRKKTILKILQKMSLTSYFQELGHMSSKIHHWQGD